MQGLWNLIGKVGQGPTQAFPYELGEKDPGLDGKSIWTLHKGKKKGTTEEVSIFAFDVKNSPPDQHEVAKAEYKRLKTLRHPNVLRFVDGFESETLIYMVTEYVKPLEEYLRENRNDLEISWGIHQVASGLDFLVNNGNLIHGNICISSILVDHGGEWKLGGVAYIQPAVQSKGATVQVLSRLPWMKKYEPPEGRFEGKLKAKSETWSPDMWGLGCLIWEVFNGSLQKSSSLKSVGKIPGNFLSHYGELVSANPRNRPNPAKFLTQCKAKGQYLCNSFVDANLFLVELQMKSQVEQKEFFKSLGPSLDSFPQQFCKDKILPQLLNAFEYGSAGSTVLGPLFKIGNLLETDEYQQKIVPCVVKLFSSTDRATRIQLLQQLDNFVQHLQPAVVNDQIFPNVALGFGDTVPAMREHTIKSMLLLTQKLSEKTINNQLLKYFAKLQMDEQPSIRTNTTVCLGKIALYLSEATRQKVIVSAFLRALRDPFPPARMAGINALCATKEYIPVKECATRVLPALCAMTVDPEKPVRVQAFKATRVMLSKVENYSEETVEKADAPSQSPASPAQVSATNNTSATWTGWAVSSLTSKFYKGNAPGDVPVKDGAPVLHDKTSEGPSNKANDVGEDEGEDEGEGGRDVTKASSAERLSEKEANSDSDYEDNEWGNDGWGVQKETVAGVKKDLISVRDELISLREKNHNLSADEGSDNVSDSDSDFGDWEQDNWTSTNNDASLPGKKEVEKTSRANAATKLSDKKPAADVLKLGGSRKPPIDEDALLSDLLGDTSQSKPTGKAESSWGDDWNDMKDSFEPDENWTGNVQKTRPSDYQKDIKNKTSVAGNMKKTQVRTSAKSKQISNSRPKQEPTFDNTVEAGWSSEDWTPSGDVSSTIASPSTTQSQPVSEHGHSGAAVDNWGTQGWDDFNSLENKPDESLSKAEIARKKREDKRRQREHALKEKRAVKGGGMKLGVVKKAD